MSHHSASKKPKPERVLLQTRVSPAVAKKLERLLKASQHDKMAAFLRWHLTNLAEGGL